MEGSILLKPEKIFNTTDIVVSFAMIAVGFLYWNLIDFYMLGAGATIFAVVIFGISFIYLLKSQIKVNAKSIMLLVLAVLSAAQFMIFDNMLIACLNFIFLSALFVYWICTATGRRLDNKLSVYIVGDAVKQGFSVPFRNFGCCVSGVTNFTKYKKAKGVRPALLGILIGLPFIAFVIYLLISADLAFENFINNILDFLKIEKLTRYFVQFLVGIPVAFYLYGLIYGNIKGRYTEKITIESVDRTAENARVVPKAAIYSILTMFNVVYLIFFAVQAAYLFSAFGGELPEVFTYAEYARRGFFELCAVAGLNLCVLLISYLIVKRGPGENPKMLRAQTVIISLFTILMIATALSKMVMYINAYGLTQLRVYVSWFIVLLLFVFVVICIRQFKKFNSARLIILGFVIMFLALSYGNVDGVIAKYNIDRYEAGTLKTFDIEALRELSDAAVPHMYDMYLRTDSAKMRQQLAAAIKDRGMDIESGFRQFNFQRHNADEIRALVPSVIPNTVAIP